MQTATLQRLPECSSYAIPTFQAAAPSAVYHPSHIEDFTDHRRPVNHRYDEHKEYAQQLWNQTHDANNQACQVSWTGGSVWRVCHIRGSILGYVDIAA
jgi:hypothetical protein